jgi:transcriptional regulator with XRE-family HTH domain
MGKRDLIPNMLGHRIKRLRESKDLSIERIAKEANVSKNTIIRLERGAENEKQMGSSLATILSVTKALGVTLSDLLDTKPEEGRDYKQVSTGPRKKRRLIKHESGAELEDLSIHLKGGFMQVGILKISGMSSIRSHRGEEFLFCVTGKIKLHIHTEEIELSKGDGVIFWGTEPHSYSFLEGGQDTKEVAIGLSVMAAGPEIQSLEELLHQ